MSYPRPVSNLAQIPHLIGLACVKDCFREHVSASWRGWIPAFGDLCITPSFRRKPESRTRLNIGASLQILAFHPHPNPLPSRERGLRKGLPSRERRRRRIWAHARHLTRPAHMCYDSPMPHSARSAVRPSPTGAVSLNVSLVALNVALMSLNVAVMAQSSRPFQSRMSLNVSE